MLDQGHAFPRSSPRPQYAQDYFICFFDELRESSADLWFVVFLEQKLGIDNYDG